MSTIDEFNDWETGSGLLDDYRGQVIDAHFVPGDRERYKLILTLMVEDNPDVSQVEEHYGCGEGWISVDGGDTIKHRSNPNQKINNRSGYGVLINEAAGLVGDTIRNWGSTRSAKTWIGSKWHMKERTTGEGEYASTKRYPVEWLGIAREEGGGAITKQVGGLREQVIGLAKSCTSHDEWVNECFSLTGFVNDDTLVKEVANPDGLWKDLKG